MKRMTYGEVLAILNEAVAERGADWVYPDQGECQTCANQEPCDWHCSEGCRYFTFSKEPCCLVGYFIDKAIDTSQLNVTDFEGEYAGSALKTLEDWEELSLDDRTKQLLINAQANQDSYRPWGESVSLAAAATP
mgnify:CR=1 FL=1|jgi:hypothetical protein